MKLKCVRNSTIKVFKEISSTRFDQVITLFPLHKGNHQNVEINNITVRETRRKIQTCDRLPIIRKAVKVESNRNAILFAEGDNSMTEKCIY